MSEAPSLPWNLTCAWCSWYIVVNARGMRRNDPGSGVEAARLMEEHVKELHGHTWREFLEDEAVQAREALWPPATPENVEALALADCAVGKRNLRSADIQWARSMLRHLAAAPQPAQEERGTPSPGQPRE